MVTLNETVNSGLDATMAQIPNIFLCFTSEKVYLSPVLELQDGELQNLLFESRTVPQLTFTGYWYYSLINKI